MTWRKVDARVRRSVRDPVGGAPGRRGRLRRHVLRLVGRAGTRRGDRALAAPGSRYPRPQRGTGERRRRRERGYVPGNCLRPGLVLADLRGPPALGLALLDARPDLFPRIHAREGLIGNGEAERRADRLQFVAHARMILPFNRPVWSPRSTATSPFTTV